VRDVATIDDVRAVVDEVRRRRRIVGFVPTMGALHEGHLSLVRLARERRAFVVLSVFVNPAQFGPGEDLAAYPRDLGTDRAAARAALVDLFFAPGVAEMYPEGFATSVHVDRLSAPLCGASRPGHFDGVALVVTKLLNIVRPDFSVFGQKDAQQAILVRRLARDLNLPGEIVIAPTEREEGGLAMSSRNRYLTPREREAALALSRGLSEAEAAYRSGERDGARLVALVRAALDEEALVRPEYVEIVDRRELGPWAGGEEPALLAVAARVGRARLIDNVFLGEAAATGAVALARGGRGCA
jgi:pantoate--beta-alanine ligase